MLTVENWFEGSESHCMEATVQIFTVYMNKLYICCPKRWIRFANNARLEVASDANNSTFSVKLWFYISFWHQQRGFEGKWSWKRSLQGPSMLATYLFFLFKKKKVYFAHHTESKRGRLKRPEVILEAVIALSWFQHKSIKSPARLASLRLRISGAITSLLDVNMRLGAALGDGTPGKM